MRNEWNRSTEPISGKEYKFVGVLFGRRPVWEFIRVEGQKMTRPMFFVLPPADKNELVALAQTYINGLAERQSTA